MNILATTEDKDEVRRLLNRFKPPVIYITDRSKAVLLLWFYLFCVLESNLCAVWALCTFPYFYLSSGN